MKLKRVGKCNQCGACCQLLGFLTDNAIGFDEWALARGLDVEYRDNCERVMVTLNHPCPQLDGCKCRLHETDKPEVCKGFPFVPSDILPGCGFRFEDEEA